MFKKWLSIQPSTTSSTFRNLQLININNIFTDLVFQTQQISIHDLACQTLDKAEDMAQIYAQQALEEKKNYYIPDIIIKTIYSSTKSCQQLLAAKIILHNVHNMTSNKDHLQY